MKTGKRLRMGKIFREDGRTVIVAMDHGLLGPMPGIENPGETIKKLVKGGADVIMTNLGIINRFAKELSVLPGVIWTVPSDATALAYIEQAVKLGVDGVKISIFGPIEERRAHEKYSIFGPVSTECEKWGMPFVAEPVPMKEGKIVTDPKIVGMVARIGAEYGADFLKVAYTGSAETFREVTNVCPVPVTILGGAKMETEKDVLEVVKGSIDGGGAGVMIGRNMWQHKNPTAMVRAISKIVHKNATVEEAIKEL